MSKQNSIKNLNIGNQYSFGQKLQPSQNQRQIKNQGLQMVSNTNSPKKRDSKHTSMKDIALGLNVKQIVERNFDPFRIPPDLGECYFHRKVTQFGKPLQDKIQQYERLDQTLSPTMINNHHGGQTQISPIKGHKKVCPCCGQEPKQQLNICCRTQQIYNINESLGFYFTYIKTMSFMLFLMAATLGVYALDEIIVNCQSKQDCLIVYGIPISKFHVFFTDVLIILNIVIILIIYILVGYLYYINAHIHKKIFLNHKKPSDYCVLLSGVDHYKVSGQDILNHFPGYQIVDILYTHQIQKYTRKLSKKSTLQAKKNLYYRRGQDHKLHKIEQKIDKLDHTLLHIKNKLTFKQEKQLRTDKIIIKFKTTEEKLRFQQNYKQGMYYTIIHTFCSGSLIEINENKLYIEPLGQPHQIVWQNFQLKSKQRYIRVLIGNIFTFLILSCSYMLVAMLTRIQKDYNGTKDIALSLTFSIVIEATNFFLDILIERLTEWEKRYTLTGKIRITLIKNFISFFLNTTLIPFSLFLFAWGTPDQDDLIRNIFTLFLLSNFVSPFISLYVRPRALYVLYKKRKILQQDKDSLQTQIKANEYFEKVDFDLNARYSIVIEILANTIFYGAIFPVGLIITLFGLGVAYWSSKWWLVRYCSIPKYSHRLGKLVVNISALFPCIFSFGYVFNLLMASEEAQFDIKIPIIIACLTIPLSLFFITFANGIAQKFVSKQYKSLQTLYNLEQKLQVQNGMKRRVADYRQLNPTTFIHSDVHQHIKQTEFEGGMWAHLESYAKEKQSGYLRRDSNFSNDHNDVEQKG